MHPRRSERLKGKKSIVDETNRPSIMMSEPQNHATVSLTGNNRRQQQECVKNSPFSSVIFDGPNIDNNFNFNDDEVSRSLHSIQDGFQGFTLPHSCIQNSRDNFHSVRNNSDQTTEYSNLIARNSNPVILEHSSQITQQSNMHAPNTNSFAQHTNQINQYNQVDHDLNSGLHPSAANSNSLSAELHHSDSASRIVLQNSKIGSSKANDILPSNISHPFQASNPRSDRSLVKSSTSSKNRKRFQIELQYAKRQHEQQLREIQQQKKLLEIERAIELSRIDDKSESSDDIFVSFQSNPVSIEKQMQNVRDWVETSHHNHNNIDDNHVVQFQEPESMFNSRPIIDEQQDTSNIMLANNLKNDEIENDSFDSRVHHAFREIHGAEQNFNITSYHRQTPDELCKSTCENRNTSCITYNSNSQIIRQTKRQIDVATVADNQHHGVQQIQPTKCKTTSSANHHTKCSTICTHQPKYQQTSTSRLEHIENWITRQTINKDLPKFSGNPLEWAHFISQYETTTNACRLTQVENQNRLLKCLSGPALSVVQPLLIYPHNVDRVIEILRSRFGRNEDIIRLLLDRVRNFNSVKDDKINSLLEFFDVFSNMVYTLESLNEVDHIRNPLLFDEVLNKLPISQRIDFHQFYDSFFSNEPKLLLLHKWLEKRVNAASKLATSSYLKLGQLDRNESVNHKSKALTLTINESVNSSKKGKVYPCFYCKQNEHLIYLCNAFKKLDVNDKWEFITKNKACISCLKPNHSIKQCKRRKRCIIDDCKYFHNPLLHKKQDDKSYSPKEISKTETNCHITDKNLSLLKIIPVTLKGPNATLDTFAMLDDGSTVTLIDANMVYRLGLSGPKKHLRLQWTNDQYNDQEDSQIISVSIKGIHKDNYYLLRRIKTVSDLNLPSQTVNMDIISKKCSYLSSFSNLSYTDDKPTILIGQDNWPIIVSRKVSHGLWNGPTVSKTLLGWVLHGNIRNDEQFKGIGYDNEGRSSVLHVHDCESDGDQDDLNIIQELVKQQWSYDLDGTSGNSTISPSIEDKRCIEIMNRTIRRVDNRFETGIFWIKDNLKLPNSKPTALVRLNSLEKKMDKNPTYAEAYISKMDEYISKGYIRKVIEPNDLVENDKTWYLPHFGIINHNKPEKLRIVFDAAAKSNGFSLNDFLLTGPDLYNSLTNVLMNFSIHKYAFIGDIREMFLQILVRSEDRHAQRFLWRGNDRDRFPDIYELGVVFFGAKCSPSLAQEIKVRNAQEHSKHFPQAFIEIRDNHYMDDYLGGADSVEDGIKLIHDIVHVHKQAGFEMVNWISNSKEILENIDENIRANRSVQNPSLNMNYSEERVLGMWWDFDEDVFKFNFNFNKINQKILNYEQIPTKRDILKIVMTIFDPLGFLSNLIIVGKILMQNIWESGIGWDEPILDHQYELWRKWSSNFKNAICFRIPRLLSNFSKDGTKVDMHVFCDASKYAFAAVVYLRFSNQNSTKCVFLNSKARVAPLKSSTIPRLELQAALLGSRLSQSIKKSLRISIDSIVLWTDSVIVLSWIKSSSKRFKMYVAQRIGEIHDLTEPSWWRYVPTKLNIADDATKDKIIDFSINSTWLNGPDFLNKPSADWPEGAFDLRTAEIEESNAVECVKSEHVFAVREQIDATVLPNVSRFSNWSRFLRTVAWVLKAVEKFKILVKKLSSNCDSYELFPNDISRAEVLIFRHVQQDSYKTEFTCLQNCRDISKTSSLYSFSNFIGDDLLIHIRGRLNNSPMIVESAKNPIILDHKHAITKLLVQHYHNLNNHIGTEKIISDLRNRFWITNIRSLVKRVKHECQHCRNSKAKPEIPIMGQLPSCRVDKPIRPFLKCGVDYFGPIEITNNRRHEKRYGVIFTCMAVRAVHIELAQDLSHNAFMNVLIQFSSRLGFPDEIYSDNGTNFVKAEKEIQIALQSWPQEELIKFCTSRKCKWFFNPPSAPHMGGAWERLIQSIKKHLYSILHERYPREFVLRTFLCEVEAIMNNRPLTYNSDDHNDAEPLTPNHFLIGSRSENFPLKVTTDSDLNLSSMWTSSQRLADIYWKRWVSEYLPKILLSNKWTKISKNLAIGDVVLVVDSNNPRNVWPKGIVEKTYPAADGCVRVVDVKTISGKFKRPVSKIIKLDVINEHNSLL